VNVLVLFTILAAGMAVQTAHRNDVRPASNRTQSPVSSDDPSIPRASGKHANDNALYRGHHQWNNQTLKRWNLVERARTDDFSVIRDVPMPWFPAVRPGEASEIPTLTSFVHKLVCSSSVVVRARIVQQQAFVTDTDDWVFTNYGARIQDVLVPTRTSISTNDEIVVTRSGGELTLYGHHVTVMDVSALPLQVGKEYLLFLKPVPGSDSLQVVDAGGAFELSDETARKTTQIQLGFGADGPVSFGKLLEAVQSATQAAACGQSRP
jgi:hypothetical protein